MYCMYIRYCEPSSLSIIQRVICIELTLSKSGGVHDKLHSADWWDLLLPLVYTPDRRDQRLLVSPPKDTGKAG